MVYGFHRSNIDSSHRVLPLKRNTFLDIKDDNKQPYVPLIDINQLSPKSRYHGQSPAPGSPSPPPSQNLISYHVDSGCKKKTPT